jgi:hypothetical protein
MFVTIATTFTLTSAKMYARVLAYYLGDGQARSTVKPSRSLRPEAWQASNEHEGSHAVGNK